MSITRSHPEHLVENTVLIEDEGATLGSGTFKTLNFTGKGVTSTDAGSDVADVTVTGNMRVTTVSYSATPTIDWDNMDVAYMELTGNATFTFTGGVPGQRVTLALKQDATGSRTAGFGSEVRFGTDITSITLTTTGSKLDYIGFFYDMDGAAKYDCVAFIKGF